jgi:WD40 repeat protein
VNRGIGLLCILTWLATPVLWWESRRPVPRETVLRQVGGRAEEFFSDDGRLFICGDGDETRVYDVIEGRHFNTLPRSIHDIATHCNGLAAFQNAETVQIVELTTGKTMATFSPKPDVPARIYLAPNGKLAATIHENNMRVWDVGAGQLLAELASPPSGFGNVSFSPDSKRLAVTDQSADHVKVIEVATLEVTVAASSANRGIGHALFAPDGRLLALARTATDEAVLLDLTSDKTLVRCRLASSGFFGNGSHWYVGHMPFFPLISIAESIGADQVASGLLNAVRHRQVFDTNTGQMVGCIPYHDAQMLPDRRTVAIYSYEEDSVQLWDFPPSTAVHPALAWTSLAIAVALTAWWWHVRRKARAGAQLQ